LQEGTRSDDLVCRYGGEEFCIVLPEVDVEETLAVAERLREAVEKSSECSLRTTQYIKITASFGVSTLAAGAESLGALIDQADSALYASKRAGRNRVTLFDTKRVAALAVG
jgi:diguanylate cyclase (GGDEF)-like protein